MPNHQPYQNPQEGQARPQTPRPEGGATSIGIGQQPQQQSASPGIGQQPQQPSPSAGIGQQPQQSAETMAQRATKAVDQVKTSAIEKVGDVRERAESGIADQRGKLVERVQRVGEALRGASEQLRHDDEFVAHYLERAGQSVDRVAEYVTSSDIDRVADDARSFARTHPAWFIGGAFVAGLALGRLLKSSTPAPGMPRTGWDEEGRF
jgi:hypothetical protein